MRRPVKHLEHISIATGDVGEIHGQVSGSGVEDRTKLGPESSAVVVIDMTPHDYAGILAATAQNGDRLLNCVFHGSPVDTPCRCTARVRGGLPYQLEDARQPPITTWSERLSRGLRSAKWLGVVEASSSRRPGALITSRRP